MVACNQQPPPGAPERAAPGTVARQMGGGAEAAANHAAAYAHPHSASDTPTPIGCRVIGKVHETFSKRGLATAIAEGDLTREGRFPICGCMAQVVIQAPKAKTATAPSCLCWRMEISRCPKHGLGSAVHKPQGAKAPVKQAPSRPVSVAATTQEKQAVSQSVSVAATTQEKRVVHNPQGAVAPVKRANSQPVSATLVVREKGVVLPVKKVAQVTPVPVHVPIAGAEEERVMLPYKKQTCDVVVRVGPLELVYPALVSEEKEPLRAATPRKVEPSVSVGLPLWAAPPYLVKDVYKTPWPKVAEVAPLTQKQEFALLKKRLTRLGKERMRVARRQRLDKAFIQKRARFAHQRKVEQLRDLIILGRKEYQLHELLLEAKRRAEAPLAPEQQALVTESCKLAREESRSMERFLLSAKARRKRECPHMGPIEEKVSPLPTVRECTVPWAGLDCSLTSLRDGGVVDGTLGAKSRPMHGDFTCNSSLGLPCPRAAISILAASLAKAKRVVAATIKFAQRCIDVGRDTLRRMYNPPAPAKVWKKKAIPEEEEKCTVPEEEIKYTSWQGCQLPEMGVRNIYFFCEEELPEEEVKQTSWQGCQLPEMGVRNIFSFCEEELPEEEVKQTIWSNLQLPAMGVRNIYAFHDDSWDASPDEDDKYTIVWSQRCGLPYRSIVQGIGKCEHDAWLIQFPEEEIKQTIWPCCQLPEMGVRSIYAFADEGLPEEEVKETIWQYCQPPEMGVRNIYAFHDDSWSATPEEEEKYTIVYSRTCGVPHRAIVSKYSRYVWINDLPTPRTDCQRDFFYWGVSGASDQESQMVLHAMDALVATHTPTPEDKDGVSPDVDDNNTDVGDDVYLRLVQDKYCTISHALYMSRKRVTTVGKLVFANKPPGSFAFELAREYSRKRIGSIRAQLVSHHVPKPVVPRLLVYREDGDYKPAKKMVTKKLAHRELEYISADYNPDCRGERQDIHTYFIYRAEFLEGCDWGEHDVSSGPAEIEKGPCNDSKNGGCHYMPFSIPIISRGDFRSRGSVLKSLLNYIPTGDLTCNSSLGCPSEIQERMEDRDAPLPSLDTLVSTLTSRKGRVVDSGENRVADKRALSESMVFRQPSVISRLKSNGPKTRTAANLNSDKVTVRMQPRGKASYTPLPRMTEEMMRKLLERGIGSTSSVALDIGIQSHVPQGMPVVAFLNIMDTRMEDPLYSSLCGSYIDLGRDRAKTLCLPLANFPLSKSIEDVEDALHGLVLATYFQDSTSFTVGKPVFQYGTLEFQEFKKSAYSDFTRVRDNWDEIAKRQNTPGDRVLAGFSVLGAVSQDYNQPLPKFGNIDIQCPPRIKPIVVPYLEPQKYFRNGSTRHFNMPSLSMPNMTGRVTVPIQTNVRTSPRIDPGEMLFPPRSSTCNSGLQADTSIAAVFTGWCPKDATGGRVLEVINIRECVGNCDSLVKYEWLAKGMISPKVRLRITTASNPFIGVSLGVCCDFFGRLSKYYKGETALSAQIANQLPQFVLPISEADVFDREIDMSLAGYNLFLMDQHFADPMVLMYVISTNTLSASDEWSYTIEVIFERVEHTVQLALKPLITLPSLYEGRVNLDIWRGPFNFPIGKNGARTQSVGINFGTSCEYTAGQSITSFPAAHLRLLQSVGGILHGRVIQTGSRAVSCVMYATLQSIDTAQFPQHVLKLPGCRIPSGGSEFQIRVQTPFQRAQIFSDDVQLVFHALGGPIGAQAVTAPYQFMVWFSHFEEEEGFIPRPIGNILTFCWATISSFTDSERFCVPARLSDIVLTGKKVRMHQNPLSDLISSCGFFKGSVKFIFRWTLNVAHTVPKGTINITTCVGRLRPLERTYVHQSWLAVMSQQYELVVPFDLVDFPGYNTTSGFGSTHMQPFMDIECDSMKEIMKLDINVELQPGFQLYGRSISQIREIAKSIFVNSTGENSSTV
uniref:Polyprotein n=1 Tax=Canberra spider orchid nepovirus TaxID=3115759 RepID=A0AAT9JAU8_9SECO